VCRGSLPPTHSEDANNTRTVDCGDRARRGSGLVLQHSLALGDNLSGADNPKAVMLMLCKATTLHRPYDNASANHSYR
jgi:hypothetical protein